MFPVTTGLDDKQMRARWSQDGQQLFAGGYPLQNNPDLFMVRRWDKAGVGRPVDIRGTRNSIIQFVALRDQRMLFTDAVGFGSIDPAGKVERIQDLGTIDIFDNPNATSRLAISADAQTVQVRDFTSGHTLRFMLTRRAITLDPDKDKALAHAITESSRIKVTDWEDTDHPKLNNANLNLLQDEISRSVALVT